MELQKSRLGDYIEEYDEINSSGQFDSLTHLQGINSNKYFQECKSNKNDIELNRYRICRHGMFSYNKATSRNGEKISIAYRYGDDCLVSPSYQCFKIKDPSKLNHDYLMMWFNRPIFDRYARFNSWGSATEFFTWECMCNVKICIPPLEEQLNLVKKYKAISKAIDLSLKNIDLLHDAIKAIFTSFFLTYESIKEAEFEKTEYGKIPCGWKYTKLSELCSIITKGTTPTTLGFDFVDKGISFIKGESINSNHSFNKDFFAFIDEETDVALKRSRIEEKDILFSIAGTLGKFAFATKDILPANTNQAIAIIRANPDVIKPEILYSYFLGDWHNEFYRKNTQQAVQANLSLGTIKELPILICDSKTKLLYESKIMPLFKQIEILKKKIEYLQILRVQLINTLK